jgi:hypothetical protein
MTDQMERLERGKRELREARRRMPLADKVALVVELQRIVLPAIRRRRPLKPWEKVWEGSEGNIDSNLR